MKNYLNRFGMSVVVILTTAFALAQKPPKQEVYEPQPTLMVLSQNQSYSRNNLSAITQDLLGVDSASTFEFVKQDIDELGFTHDVYRQLYRALPVEFAQIKIHAKEGQVTALTNTTVVINDLDTRPTLSERSALNSAKSFVNGRTYLWEDAQSSALMDYQGPGGEL